jgi:hypothetical protein
MIVKKAILACLSGMALLTAAACSDTGTDNTQTESVPPPATDQPAQPPAETPNTGGSDTMQQAPAQAEQQPAQ